MSLLAASATPEASKTRNRPSVGLPRICWRPRSLAKVFVTEAKGGYLESALDRQRTGQRLLPERYRRLRIREFGDTSRGT